MYQSGYSRGKQHLLEINFIQHYIKNTQYITTTKKKTLDQSQCRHEVFEGFYKISQTI